MATQNSIDSQNPIQVALGGTGAATFTDKGVLYGNTTSAIGVTAVGTAAQVLTSNGSGVAPTFQTAPVAYLVLIQSQTASSSTNINFTTGITATYNTYKFIWSNVVPATNTDVLQFQISTDGGSTFSTALQGGLNYAAYTSSSFTNVNSTTILPMSDALSNTASLGSSGYLNCFGVTSGADFFATGLSVFNGSTTGTGSMAMLICGSTTANVNAFRFSMSTGNISTGTFTLFGVLE